MNNKPTFIYILTSTEDSSKIRYIGKTIWPVHKRLIAHLWHCKEDNNCNSHLANWIRKVLRNGFQITITQIGKCSFNWKNEEQAWIAYGRAEKWDLTNMTNGGEGSLGYIPTLKHRQNMSKAKLGKQSKLKGRHLSKDHIIAITIARNLKPSQPWSEDRKIKQSIIASTWWKIHQEEKAKAS
jgi:hypothetical protein